MSVPTIETVALDSLREYPGNARRGDVAAIAESLRVNGQYVPIVAQRSTRYILAGNHTAKAARSLGMTSILVSWVDCDDRAARRIVVADNRTSDLALYGEADLADLLHSLPDLDGTGFTRADLDVLDGLYSSAGEEPTDFTQSPNEGDDGDIDTIRLKAGPVFAGLDPDIYRSWEAALLADVGGKAAKAGEQIRRRLQLPQSTRRAPQRPRPEDVPTVSVVEAEMVDVETLEPYPGNARQGDVGAIMESLSVNGQYRPIVANRRDRTILKGNHTWQAALMLEMTHVAVTWVDVDDDAAKRIVLADNRTSDLATYDPNALRDLLAEIGAADLSGTGFDGDDFDALLSGGASRPVETGKRVTVSVGDYATRLERPDFDRWFSDLPRDAEVLTLLARLDLPPEAILQ